MGDTKLDADKELLEIFAAARQAADDNDMCGEFDRAVRLRFGNGAGRNRGNIDVDVVFRVRSFPAGADFEGAVLALGLPKEAASILTDRDWTRQSFYVQIPGIPRDEDDEEDVPDNGALRNAIEERFGVELFESGVLDWDWTDWSDAPDTPEELAEREALGWLKEEFSSLPPKERNLAVVKALVDLADDHGRKGLAASTLGGFPVFKEAVPVVPIWAHVRIVVPIPEQGPEATVIIKRPQHVDAKVKVPKGLDYQGDSYGCGCPLLRSEVLLAHIRELQEQGALPAGTPSIQLVECPFGAHH